ncbi:hypothetical protein ABMA28_006799 [Loxostege sticticalis]|uniref:Reverse transcriptase domain-containing protein n=1 Tax=Loxostege sticticalis TaxID=481309 RepID=A0ABD0TNH0_LOXSC
MYHDIVCILKESAEATYHEKRRRKHNCITGWNKHVSAAHGEARFWYQSWLQFGKPNFGFIYDKMRDTKRKFKAKLKFCQNNEKQIKLDIIAQNHADKNFNKFWKNTNKLNPKPRLPTSVAGMYEPTDIANAFQKHFKVESPLPGEAQMLDAGRRVEDLTVRFTAREVASTIKGMVRGKSPGHDDLSIEHLKYAGVHLPRVLAMFFSLSTVIAKVLDSLLDRRLDEHIKIHDAQFGFKSGLSTESAIFCLKQTVQYYTARKTPVYACFLDLSKAFDLVSYSLLWKKLDCETSLPPEVISIFKYWYDNQRNCVKWAGSRSDVYGLQCGVRQGGLSSPKLFNLYMNRLIEELSSTYVGCHVGGVCINNISYADDMVLLSPSIGALRKLLHMCEEYAVSHGLRYNSLKSEFMVFQAGAAGRQRSLPSVTLGGTDLKRVHQFKYLGHWVTDSLSDSVDVERERRALCVRCNMLARRFRTYGALRVQYNNAFRMLFGLPRHCSASSMFAEAHIDCFYTIIRKWSASLWARVRGNSNGILSALADRWDSPLLRRWLQLHAPATRYLYI